MKRSRLERKTPLAPGKPLSRYAELKTHKPMRTGRKGFRKYGAWDRVAALEAVVARDGLPVALPGEPVDLHHILPKRVLSRIGRADLVADPANLMALGRRRHDQHETRYRPLSWEELPASAIDFADALNLIHLLVRLYPSAKEATA